MPLRVAFDMDGTLADFEVSFRDYEHRLFGTEEAKARPPEPEVREYEERQLAETSGTEEVIEKMDRRTSAEERAVGEIEAQRRQSLYGLRRRLDRVWRAIESTPNYWTTLRPIDLDAIRRIRDMAERHRWEVFFITQRPATGGDTVQRQTQRWLIAQGFDMPSVIVVSRSRGKLAAALHLDYLVDDSPKNAVDVISDSRARVLLIVRDADEATEASARRLGIGVVRSIGEALDILEQATEGHSQPTLLGRLAKLVGWKARSL